MLCICLHANQRNVIRIWPGERWDHGLCCSSPPIGGVLLLRCVIYICIYISVWISLINFSLLSCFRFVWNYLEMHSTRFPVVHGTRGILGNISWCLWFLLGYFLEYFFHFCMGMSDWYWRVPLAGSSGSFHSWFLLEDYNVLIILTYVNCRTCLETYLEEKIGKLIILVFECNVLFWSYIFYEDRGSLTRIAKKLSRKELEEIPSSKAHQKRWRQFHPLHSSIFPEDKVSS